MPTQPTKSPEQQAQEMAEKLAYSILGYCTIRRVQGLSVVTNQVKAIILNELNLTSLLTDHEELLKLRAENVELLAALKVNLRADGHDMYCTFDSNRCSVESDYCTCKRLARNAMKGQ